MSTSLISSNVTIKINGAVTATGASGNAQVNLYTVPANSYLDAIITVVSSNGGGSYSIGGTIIEESFPSNTRVTFYNVKVAAGELISIQGNNSTNVTATVKGVLFTNTP